MSDVASAQLPLVIELLRQVDAGALENLDCPVCKKPQVSAWFTQSVLGQYRTWLLCSSCRLEWRFQNSERPASFRADKVNIELQLRDNEMLQKPFFPAPKQE